MQFCYQLSKHPPRASCKVLLLVMPIFLSDQPHSDFQVAPEHYQEDSTGFNRILEHLSSVTNNK